MSTSTLAHRLDPAHLAEATDSARERLRDRVEPTAELARERAEVARERASELAEAIEPTRQRVAGAVGPALRTLVRALLMLPSVLAKVVGWLSGVVETLAERGREAAARVEPPKARKRATRLRTAGWVAGGFAAGAATGWIVHARMQARRQEPYAPAGVPQAPGAPAPSGSPYGEEAAAIDARHRNADMS